jgi:hypothetical protein
VLWSACSSDIKITLPLSPHTISQYSKIGKTKLLKKVNLALILSSIYNPIQAPTVLFSYFYACPIKD